MLMNAKVFHLKLRGGDLTVIISRLGVVNGLGVSFQKFNNNTV